MLVFLRLSLLVPFVVAAIGRGAETRLHPKTLEELLVLSGWAIYPIDMGVIGWRTWA